MTTPQIPYNQFVKIILAEQYQYFKDNGYEIFSAYQKNSHSKSFYFTEKEKYQLAKKETFCEGYSLSSYVEKRTDEDFFYSLSAYYLSTDPNIRKEFFYDFYKNHPECEEQFLKYLSKFRGMMLSEIYQDFVNHFSNSKQETINLLHKFPVSVWEYKMVPLDNIENYFEDKGFEKEEFNQFLFDFLNIRKKQLPPYKYEIRDYLMSHFNQNEEQLKPYFDILPVLKAEFIDPEIDIFIHDYKFSNVIHLGIDKMYKSFLIEKWQHNHYKEALFKFCRAIQKHYKIDTCFTEKKEDDDGDYFIIEFLHNNENIHTKDIKKEIIEYFSMLRYNSEYNKEPNAAETWLFNKELENKVSKKNTNTNKKKI